MIPIIDAGHGGIIAGNYQTRGKRSPKWADGSQLFEGEFNRAIKARVIEALSLQNIPYIDLNPRSADTSLKTRVKAANWHQKKHKNTFLISIHSNAGGGKGCEVFTALNASNKSREISGLFEYLFFKHFPGEIWRGQKQRDFYIIKNTNMPAALIELFFMDNERECKKWLLTRAGRDTCAAYVLDVIKYCING